MRFQRLIWNSLWQALRAEPRFMQVLQGPRQVGKTTLAEQLAERWKGPVSLVAADSAIPPERGWIEPRWNALAEKSRVSQPGLLIIDEIQKVPRWSEEVKGLWDQERRAKRGLRVLILGSSSLLLQKGLSESLAGRFQLWDCQHWSWPECRDAFGMSLDEWVFYGGYPGAAPLRRKQNAWADYVSHSLVETVLGRDILQLNVVTKPALLRQLFGLAATHPAHIYSYTKMLDQLNEAGNTTTLAHYLTLLEAVFLASGLQPFRQGQSVQRGGKPKLILWNNALISALSGRTFEVARADKSWWGHMVENAVGASLLMGLPRSTHRVFYWRDRDQEVDFVVKGPSSIWGVEVKSGRLRNQSGLNAFKARFKGAKTVLLGQEGISINDFFESDLEKIFT